MAPPLIASFRLVGPEEVEALSPRLAQLHLEAHEEGMALGELASESAGLTRSYGELAGVLDAEHHLLVIGEIEDEVVAMAQLIRASAANARHRAEVARVAVARDRRGRGIGRALMRFVEETARAARIDLLWLTTHADTPATRLYDAAGYVAAGVIPNYSRLPDGTLAPSRIYYRDLISPRR